MRSVRVLVAVLSIGACHSGTSPRSMEDAGTDTPPPSPYSISIGAPDVVADGVTTQTVTITGLKYDHVLIDLDRSSAGKLDPTDILLDASGHATATYTPCDYLFSDCVGPATLRMALAADPTGYVATDNLTLHKMTVVGDVTPCLTHDNLMYVHDEHGEMQTPATASWTATSLPDSIELYAPTMPQFTRGTFSLVPLATPLAVGVYDQAQRAAFEDPGHPGMEVLADGVGGCNRIDGRFQVHELTTDPILGTVYSATISFEQLCDDVSVAIGCFHYETPPPTQTVCPTIDPANVSVEVRSTAGDGTPDTGATAIFTDATGTVVADAQVDICGQAQASLPSGGTLTTIEHVGYGELVNTYRGLRPGDHVIVNRGSPTKGRSDMMLATFVPPAAASTMALLTACGGGSWAKGNGPVDAYMTFYDNCRTPTFDMLTIASIPNAPQQFVWQTGLTHAPNGNVTVAGSWAPMGTATITLANVPPSSPSINAMWSTKINATPVQMGSQSISVPVAGNQSVSVAYPPGAGDGTVVDVIISYFAALTAEMRSVVDTGAPSSITVDFASLPIPLVSAMQQTTNGGSWTQTAGGTADVRTMIWRAQLHTGVDVLWTLVEPYDGQALTTLPALPAGHAAEDPTVDPQAQLTGAAVSYVDYDAITGFTLQPPTGSYRSHSSSAQTYNFSF